MAPQSRSQIFGSASASRVVAGGAWQVVVGTMAGVLIFGWIVLGGRPEPRGFGKEGFEFFITANAAMTLLNAATIGLGQAFVKFVSEAMARSREEAQSVAARGTRVILLWGAGIFAAWLLFTFLGGNRPQDLLAFSFIAALVPVMVFRDILNSVIGSVHRFDYLAVAGGALGAGMFATGLLFLTFFRAPEHTPLLASIPLWGNLAMVAVGLAFFRKCSPFRLISLFRERADPAFAVRFSAYGIHALLANFSTFGLNIALSVFTVKVMSIYGLGFSHSDVTVYGLTVIYAFLILYITLMALPMVPEVSRAHALGDRRLLHSVLRTLTKFGFSLAPFVVVLLTVSGNSIMPLFTPEARGQWWPMALAAVGMAFSALATIFAAVLVGTGRAREAGRAFGIAAVLLVALTPPLSLAFGLAGAALALLLSGTFVLPVLMRRVGRLLEFRYSPGLLLRPLAASLLLIPLLLPGLGPLSAGASPTWVKMAMALSGAFVFFIIYTFLLTLLGFYDEEDYRLIEDTATGFGLRPVGLLAARGLRRLHRMSPLAKPPG
ncbi:MAG: polysaccharide biosynthesis C-terminal domain-containing protein [Halobacteria archaeon]